MRGFSGPAGIIAVAGDMPNCIPAPLRPFKPDMQGRLHRRSRALRASVDSTSLEPVSRVRLSAPSERAPTSAPSARTTIDIILQGSTVELFHAHRVAVAPLGSDRKSVV